MMHYKIAVLPPNASRRVFYHELGHCALSLHHNYEKESFFNPKSYMHPYTYNEKIESHFKDNKDHYIDNIFKSYILKAKLENN